MMVGIAVVGVGHWGPHLVRSLHDHPDSAVLWVVDHDQDRLKAVSSRFRDVATTTDLADALSDSRVEALVVATPTISHVELALAGLRAGKHVLVEKPLADSAMGARLLCEEAGAQGLVLMVGQVFLFNPAVQAAKGLIDEGRLGRLHYASMRRTNLGPVRVDVGAGWDLASHDIAIANHWLGGRPIAAAATAGSWLNEGIHDAIFATLRYPDDVLVHIEASWLNPRKVRQASLVGDSAMLTVDDMDLVEPLRLYDKGVAERNPVDVADTFVGFRSQIREGNVTIPRVVLGEPLRSECDAFLRRVTGDAGTLSDGWSGLDVVEVLEALDRSLAGGGGFVDVGLDRA
jgi:predicted dehydrogenase